MEHEITLALLSFGGTLIGTFGGIITSARLTNYRIKKLEEEVKEHNNFAKRLPVVERDIEVANHRIADLENKSEKQDEKIINLTRRG